MLCSILVLIRPFSKFGGPSAFLALTLKELAFSVQENRAQQFESTVFSLSAGFIAIGFSTLAMWLASLVRSHGKTTIARLIPALFLVAICFSAGFLKSWLPRLTVSSRIACFIAIWLLTTDAEGTEPMWPPAEYFIWIISVSAIATLVPSMLLLRWSSTHLASEIASCFSKLQLCLRHHLGEAFQEIPVTALSANIEGDLLRQSVSLDAVYQQAAFEFRIGRVDVKQLKPFIRTIEHLRRELSRDMTFPQHRDPASPLNDAIEAFYTPALELGCAILDSISAIEKIVFACFEQSVSPVCARSHEHNLFMARNRLSAALVTARAELRTVSDSEEFELLLSSEGNVDLPRRVFEMCSFMITLLQVAQALRSALDEAQNILRVHSTSNVRLWYPRLSSAWLGVTPNTVLLEERGIIADQTVEDEATTSPQEELEGIAEQKAPLAPAMLPMKRAPETDTSSIVLWRHFTPRRIWDSPRTLAVRLRLSRYAKSVKHSPHLRHAFKNAAGITVLSIPAFLPVTSPGNAWFRSYFGQWMLISFLWVLETNTGATWRVGYLRLSGTVAGALYAYVASLICQRNAYAIVVFLTLAEVPISYVVTKTAFPSLGIVAFITLPPILLPSYFNETARSPGMLAVLRGGLIAAGIVAALLMNSFLFPRHCRVLFLNSTCRALGLFSQLYMGLSRDLLDRRPPSSFARQKSLELEVDIRQTLHRAAIFLVTMDDELSLVPKPRRCYQRTLAVLRKLLDLLTGIRKIRQSIPRREAVEAVVHRRRELMSNICLSLFACEHAFRSRQSLPQFLPSARDALQALEKDVEEQIARARTESSRSLGLPALYALAEINLLRDLVQDIEDLLDLTRQLFGTSAWYSGPLLTPSPTIDEATTPRNTEL
ncbi:putative fusaric acid resistance protein-like [Lyophyllum shimeji]|uniref:Fusaric acid resistance protein-like n=1 Tax=Lyophyllum shimeji TaxID=47721 RepID=A0A9P3UIC5_LYOSH|nr:putative fusaric acid resistance protein-like [Lyophyllum shimeji]